MYAYAGFGQTVPPPKKQAVRPVTTPSTRFSEEQKAYCRQAYQAGLYPSHLACNEAIEGGAPMVDLSAQSPAPGSEAAYSKTKLYVGIGIAVVVVGIGAYLISK